MTLEYKHVNVVAFSAILFMSIYHLSSQIIHGSFLIGAVFLCQSILAIIALLSANQTHNSRQTSRFKPHLALSLVSLAGASLFILLLSQSTLTASLSTWFCVLLFCSALCLPNKQAFIFNAFIVGLYYGCIVFFTDNAYSFIESALALTLVGILVSALSHIMHQLNLSITRSTTRDPVTGCIQPAAFKVELEKLTQLFDRYQTPFSLISIQYQAEFDSDKDLQVWLKELASLYQSRLRKTDVLCHFNSQKFMALLPNTDQNSAELLCADLKKCSDAYLFSYAKKVNQGTAQTQLHLSAQVYSKNDHLSL